MRATSQRLLRAAFVCAVSLCFGLTGCVTVPPVDGQAREDLASHVQFLAQPALRGRKPGTFGSANARRYIEKRFEAYGLVPWRGEKKYELSFRAGKNVVGVLPGSDPALATEIVLVSAHYDHLGRDAKGNICPGAADNASGVAALLETAGQMIVSENRPKRTVVFVAFDSEEQMLLGSFAFSGREDVKRANIVAVVNIDMLGRDFLDVVRNTVFVTGTEQYPALREQICAFGTNSGIRVLTIGTDLVGPRSDHVAFETRDIPCLFFSCGTYGDYHKPSDIAEKLNYADLKAATRVIQHTVKAIANSQRTPEAVVNDPDLHELRTLNTVLSEINGNFEAAGIKQKDLEAVKKLHTTVEQLLTNGGYNRQTKEELAVETAGVLSPYLLPVHELETTLSPEQQQQTRLLMQYLQLFYLSYRVEFINASRELVQSILKQGIGLFRSVPTVTHEIYDIAADDISLSKTGSDSYALHVLVGHVILKMHRPALWRMQPGGVEIIMSFNPFDCEGTREQLADACLLRLRAYQTNELRSEKIKRVLQVVTGNASGRTYQQLIDERLDRGSFTNETDWILSCIIGTNHHLSWVALDVARDIKDSRITTAACQIVTNRSLRADVRAVAINRLTRKNRPALLALCEVLDDTTPTYRFQDLTAFEEGNPFAERAVIKILRRFFEQQEASNPPKSISDLAHQALKTVAKKDFGKDAARWRKWIQSPIERAVEAPAG